MSGRFLQRCFLLVCHMAILVKPARGIHFAHCAFDVALLPPRFPSNWLPFASLIIRLLSCFGFGLLAAVREEFLFHRLQTGDAFRLVSSTNKKPTQSFDLPIFSDHCSCSDSDKVSHTTTVGPSSSPQNFKSPRPADWKKGGAYIIASPSSLLALLIFCSARSIHHVGDLYPASSFPPCA